LKKKCPKILFAKILIFGIFFSFAIHYDIIAQDLENKNVASQRDKLSRLRRDIDDYRKKIQNEKRKEEQILENLAKLDREIDLNYELVAELKKEERQKLKVVGRISDELRTKLSELERLQEIYKKRIVTFYKFGRIKDIELLLSSKSLNQTLAWFKYIKLLTQNDRRNFQNLLRKKEKIEAKNTSLKKELIAKHRIINEKEVEFEKLKVSSQQRSGLLTQVQKNKQTYLDKLKQYQASEKEIQRLISEQERKRITLETQGIIEQTDFPMLHGNMIWPTNGLIINHFGRHQHPKWKTVTENNGIDIQAEFGQEIQAVANGIVTVITWMRGRGNMVMINHLGGYFTVYTHLSQIRVQIDQKVQMGQIIGNVGDTGSLHGPMLHFEIWKSNKVLNPEKWLR
jgi:murein hydrolase activator